MPEDEDLEEPDQAWLFQANPEACETCVAFDASTWPEEPSLPHANCECDLVQANFKVNRGVQATDSCGNSWSYSIAFLNIKIDAPEYEVEWEADIHVECRDGTFESETVTLHLGLNTDYASDRENFDRATDLAEGLILDQLFDAAEALLAETCGICAPEIV